MSDDPIADRGIDELYAERKTARARADRRGFLAANSHFVRTMMHAIAQYLAARGEGVTRDDAIHGLEEELRGCWPKSVSKFAPVCNDCEDTGWREQECREYCRCGRELCQKNPERQHTYTEPCVCANGDRMRAKVRHVDDGIAAAGRAKRKGGFTRMGR